MVGNQGLLARPLWWARRLKVRQLKENLATMVGTGTSSWAIKRCCPDHYGGHGDRSWAIDWCWPNHYGGHGDLELGSERVLGRLLWWATRPELGKKWKVWALWWATRSGWANGRKSGHCGGQRKSSWAITQYLGQNGSWAAENAGCWAPGTFSDPDV